MMIYLNAICSKWSEEVFHKIFDNSVIFSHERHTHEKNYENDFPKEKSKTILKKKREIVYLKKRTKMKIYSVFILHARFMMQVFQKNKDFLLNSLWFCVNFEFSTTRIHWNIVTATLSLNKKCKIYIHSLYYVLKYTIIKSDWIYKYTSYNSFNQI